MPFQLGHPLGAPNVPEFQRKVLMAVLELFKAPSGPVLEDFPEDEPENNEITVLACPVNFAHSVDEDEETDAIKVAFLREMTAMRPWYDMALSKRQRTTVGAGNIELEKLGEFIYAFLEGKEPENPRDDVPIPNTLKLAIEDLKAYYVEGITAQPGQENASSQVLQDWFWDETVAGKVLLELKKVCEASEDRMMSFIGGHFIVPGDVARRQPA
ncbi:MAG: hypothetical protein PVG61_01495 [Dehalococcoidia bacterium]